MTYQMNVQWSSKNVLIFKKRRTLEEVLYGANSLSMTEEGPDNWGEKNQYSSLTETLNSKCPLFEVETWAMHVHTQVKV